MERFELLAPAGNMDKLKIAIMYGADAVYIGGKAFSLRSMSDNFTNDEIVEAIDYCHERNKKIYVTVNVFARNYDLDNIKEYLKFLGNTTVDGILVSDPGIFSLAISLCPNTDIHISTQANNLNKLTAKFWQGLGAKRIVVARELSLKEISEIHDYCPDLEIEAFVHGAMCISYSGRCLLSDYLDGRSSNRGECVQSCRWNYTLTEATRQNEQYPIEEDEKGTYILNSKDLNMIEHLGEMQKAGIVSLKIEGRMKSEYYLATVINTYRRAIDSYFEFGEKYKENPLFYSELLKTSHRAFTTAYMLNRDNHDTVNYANTQSVGSMQFIGIVLESTNSDGYSIVEMRNRFKVGDLLEILSPGENFNKTFVVGRMEHSNGELLEDAKVVQEKLRVYTDFPLVKGEILRKEY